MEKILKDSMSNLFSLLQLKYMMICLNSRFHGILILAVYMVGSCGNAFFYTMSTLLPDSLLLMLLETFFCKYAILELSFTFSRDHGGVKFHCLLSTINPANCVAARRAGGPLDPMSAVKIQR